MDFIYLTLTCTLLPLCLLLKIFQIDTIAWFNKVMEFILQWAFSMPKYQVTGFRRQRTVLQLVYETIPQLLLQFYILHYFTYRNENYDQFQMDLHTIIFSILTALLHFVLEFLMLKLESKAIKIKLVKYIVVCFNAR